MIRVKLCVWIFLGNYVISASPLMSFLLFASGYVLIGIGDKCHGQSSLETGTNLAILND